MQAQQCAQLTGTNRPIGLIRSGKGMASRHPNPDRILPNVSQKPGHTDVALNPVPGSSSGLVAMARAKHPIPSRTRKLSAAAPMVLRQKTRESRSPPDLTTTPTPAGWSSPVARQAHNLKAAGSNPAPATTKYNNDNNLISLPRGRLRRLWPQGIAAFVAAFTRPLTMAVDLAGHKQGQWADPRGATSIREA